MTDLDAWLYSPPLDAPDLDLWRFWWSPIYGELEEVRITRPDAPRPYGWWRTAEVRALVEAEPDKLAVSLVRMRSFGGGGREQVADAQPAEVEPDAASSLPAARAAIRRAPPWRGAVDFGPRRHPAELLDPPAAPSPAVLLAGQAMDLDAADARGHARSHPRSLRRRAAVEYRAGEAVGSAMSLSPRLMSMWDALEVVRWGRPVAAAYVPVVLRNVANLREHWATKAKRAKAHRSAAYLAMRPQLWDLNGLPPPSVVVLLTRIYCGRGRRMDDDGAARAMKAVRDGVADALGIDDGSERVTWLVDQAKGPEAGVRIEVYAKEVRNGLA